MSLGKFGSDRRERRERYLLRGLYRAYDCTCLRTSTLNGNAKGTSDATQKTEDHLALVEFSVLLLQRELLMLTKRPKIDEEKSATMGVVRE